MSSQENTALNILEERTSIKEYDTSVSISKEEPDKAAEHHHKGSVSLESAALAFYSLSQPGIKR